MLPVKIFHILLPYCYNNFIMYQSEYDYLLNSDKELDLLHKRFIVFELDNIKDHKILFPRPHRWP